MEKQEETVSTADSKEAQEDSKPKAPANASRDTGSSDYDDESMEGMEITQEEDGAKTAEGFASGGDAASEGDLSEAAKKEKRLAMNRVSARARRRRKKMLLETLSSQVTVLKKKLQDKDAVIAQLRLRNEQLEAGLRQALASAVGNQQQQQGSVLLPQALPPQHQQRTPVNVAIPQIQQYLQQIHGGGGSPSLSVSASAGELPSSQQEEALRILLQRATPNLNPGSSTTASTSALMPPQQQLLSQLVASSSSGNAYPLGQNQQQLSSLMNAVQQRPPQMQPSQLASLLASQQTAASFPQAPTPATTSGIGGGNASVQQQISALLALQSGNVDTMTPVRKRQKYE